MMIKQGEMTTKTILSIVGIIALIIGALFLAGSIQRNLFGLSLAYGQPYYNETVGKFIRIKLGLYPQLIATGSSDEFPEGRG